MRCVWCVSLELIRIPLLLVVTLVLAEQRLHEATLSQGPAINLSLSRVLAWLVVLWWHVVQTSLLQAPATRLWALAFTLSDNDLGVGFLGALGFLLRCPRDPIITANLLWTRRMTFITL